MNNIDLKKAFGETPESVKQCIRHSLHNADRRHYMKRKFSTILAAAALAALLIGASAFAAVHFGISQLFTGDETVNEVAIGGAQTVDAAYEGDAVSLTMNDALYDAEGGTYALSWTLENLNGEDGLYVINEGVTFGGQDTFSFRASNASEYILPEGETECMLLGELPENAGNECEMSFAILRALIPVEPLADGETPEDVLARGALPIAPDGLFELEWAPGYSYVEALLASGYFEIADQFTVSFTLDPSKLEGTAKAYNGQDVFVFDDYEIRIRDAEVAATTARVVIEYITPEPPEDGGPGFGAMYGFSIAPPDMEIWCSSSGGTIGDPVQLDNGRYMCIYDFDAEGLFVVPDMLRVTLVTYEKTEPDVFAPTYHTEDAIDLTFE